MEKVSKYKKCILETSRTYLREFTLDDTQKIFEMRSDSQIMRYMPEHLCENITFTNSVAIVEDNIKAYKNNPGLGAWPVILKVSEEFIGWVLLNKLEKTNEIEIGYHFIPKFWGQGLCFEVTTALLEYGFQIVGLNRIVGITNPENKVSIRILEKLGLKYEKKSYFYGANFFCYSLNKDDYIW